MNNISEYRINNLVGKKFNVGKKDVEIYEYFINYANEKVLVLKVINYRKVSGWTSKTVTLTYALKYKGIKKLLEQDLESKLNYLIK